MHPNTLDHRASDRHTLTLALIERTLCRIFHSHGIRRLGFKSQLYFMTWGKVSPPQFPPPLTTNMLKSALSTSGVIEDVFIHSAELRRDCTSCRNTMQIKLTLSHSKSWPGGEKRQVHNCLQYKVIMAIVTLEKRAP